MLFFMLTFYKYYVTVKAIKEKSSNEGATRMKVVEKSIKDLKPYEKNTKKHDQTQIDNVAESIRQYGFVQPIVIDKNNEVVIGHCRLLAAEQLNLETVPCVRVDDLTDEQVKALRIVDNKSNESEWDFDFLAEELAEIDLSDFDFDFGIKRDNGGENPYTEKTEIPQYEIDENFIPVLEICYDDYKSRQLIEEIEESNVTKEEKDFLKLAAQRHMVFDYGKIAHYYAGASEEMQKLMEKSALVIIDYDNAIANGYAELCKSLEDEGE